MARADLVSPIILNTNKRADTLACLESLSAQQNVRLSTFVLDNKSTDGSNEAISHRYPEVTIVKLNENKGYAGNNNEGIRVALAAGGVWIFVLNEDVVLDAKSIEELLDAASQVPSAGILG
ncbi:MAG: glycosyltransferase, partial [Anaerolineales bacterium]